MVGCEGSRCEGGRGGGGRRPLDVVKVKMDEMG